MTDCIKARRLKIWGWILYSSILLVAFVWFVSSFVFWILGITNNISDNMLYIQKIINWCCGAGFLISFILMFVGLALMLKAAKYDKINVSNISFISDGNLDLKRERSLRKFSWGGFWCPVCMLFFTKQYLWAILVLIFDTAGLLPRILVGAYARRRLAENRKFINFEEYERKAKMFGIISTIIGILFGILMIVWCYISIVNYLEENPYYLYML